MSGNWWLRIQAPLAAPAGSSLQATPVWRWASPPQAVARLRPKRHRPRPGHAHGADALTLYDHGVVGFLGDECKTAHVLGGVGADDSGEGDGTDSVFQKMQIIFLKFMTSIRIML